METNMNQNTNPQPETNQGQYQPYQQPQYQQNYYQQQAYGQYRPPVNPAKPSGLAIASMILGICSIVFCAGVITGLICAILAIVFASKMAKQAPGGDLGPSRGFVNAGKICGIIGLILSILFIVIWVLYVVLFIYLFQELTPYLQDLTPYLDGNIDIQINAASLLN